MLGQQKKPTDLLGCLTVGKKWGEGEEGRISVARMVSRESHVEGAEKKVDSLTPQNVRIPVRTILNEGSSKGTKRTGQRV